MNPTNRGPRIAAIVAAGALGLFSFGLFAGSGVLLWADGQKDAAGYLTTDPERLATGARALTSENLDLDLDGLDGVVGRDAYGNLRLTVDAGGDAPVFAGIARTSDVNDYLRGVDRAVVTDFGDGPPVVDHRDAPGAAAPAPPARERIWDASTDGTGRQTLTWDVRDGDWSVVVMNADGSPGVDADVSAGAKLGFLDEAGWILLGTGGIAFAGAVAFLLAGVRPPRGGQRSPEEPKPFAPRSVDPSASTT
jgi:hypothetical protein